MARMPGFNMLQCDFLDEHQNPTNSPGIYPPLRVFLEAEGFFPPQWKVGDTNARAGNLPFAGVPLTP